jgi:hypothetical protein
MPDLRALARIISFRRARNIAYDNRNYGKLFEQRKLNGG